MNVKRRSFLRGLLGLSLPALFSACTSAQSSAIENVNDLAQLAQQARAQNVPIMLFVSAPHCRYCHQLEYDVIVPMTKNRRYDSLVLLRRLNLGQDQVIDWDGVGKDPVNIASRYKAQMTPTIIFLSPDGEVIADKIQGVVVDIDQYGGMIDGRLNHALTVLGNSAQIVHH